MYENVTKVYIGLTGGAFKERYQSHTKSFKHCKYKNETVRIKVRMELEKQKS